MTQETIKKAFEQMKKELKKETGINGGFTMSAKQMKNRTATYAVCNNIPYEVEIARTVETDARVQGYDTWTDEEKARSHQRHLETVALYERELAEFGTKENKARQMAKRVVDSRAFAKFQQVVGEVTWEIEQMDIIYYVRFHY